MSIKAPNRTANKATNMSIRQPARRPLGPMKIRFNPILERELLWKDSVDAATKFSVAFTGFAMVIFLS
jgi:hypothetical protein